MDSTTGLLIFAWIFLLLLYLGLARVLTEVRSLRTTVHQLQASQTRAAEPDARLPASLPSSVEVVAVLDSTCRDCWELADEIGLNISAGRVAILTYEPESTWRDGAPGVPVVQSADAWSSFAPLSPPVLARVSAAGQVAEIFAPVSIEDARSKLQQWLPNNAEVRS
ncbi:MAG TPA: hypothetical protein VFV89_12095 [Nocardioides sp.]|uniref:hypothetical protein n=1 Tax=Nocardioides sp. TaxID=35761 RepID=UPI002E362080|nr:hypothetical protein [Nocardioides sp.]HEX5088541.1 hypothetical protein [Nocardioides sp.]